MEDEIRGSRVHVRRIYTVTGATEMPRFLFSALGMLAGIGATAGDEWGFGWIFSHKSSTWGICNYFFRESSTYFVDYIAEIIKPVLQSVDYKSV